MVSDDGTDGALRRAGRLDRPLHVRCGAARALDVPVSGEEQEQRVAPELEHVAAVTLGDGDQLGEDRRDGRDELLGAEAAKRRQALRQRREARDVDGDECPVDGAPALARVVAPGMQKAGHVGSEQAFPSGTVRIATHPQLRVRGSSRNPGNRIGRGQFPCIDV